MSNLSHEEHGGLDPLDLKRRGLKPDSMLDFSVNSNPFGPSPYIAKVLRCVDISGYPDNHCSVPADKLVGLNNVSENQGLIGNGREGEPQIDLHYEKYQERIIFI